MVLVPLASLREVKTHLAPNRLSGAHASQRRALEDVLQALTRRTAETRARNRSSPCRPRSHDRKSLLSRRAPGRNNKGKQRAVQTYTRQVRENHMYIASRTQNTTRHSRNKRNREPFGFYVTVRGTCSTTSDCQLNHVACLMSR